MICNYIYRVKLPNKDQDSRAEALEGYFSMQTVPFLEKSPKTYMLTNKKECSN